MNREVLRTARGAPLLALLALTAPSAGAASLQLVSNWAGGVTGLPSDVSMYIYVPNTSPSSASTRQGRSIPKCSSVASVALGALAPAALRAPVEPGALLEAAEGGVVTRVPRAALDFRGLVEALVAAEAATQVARKEP
jgi:hypothetical protein